MVQTVYTVETPADFLAKAGLGSPLTRGLVLGGVAAAGAYVFGLPGSAFMRDKRGVSYARPWSFISEDPNGTPLHFLVIPAVIAAVGCSI